ncbi:unnamed protein product, partial [Scytosiphon promiscuus]
MIRSGEEEGWAYTGEDLPSFEEEVDDDAASPAKLDRRPRGLRAAAARAEARDASPVSRLLAGIIKSEDGCGSSGRATAGAAVVGGSSTVAAHATGATRQPSSSEPGRTGASATAAPAKAPAATASTAAAAAAAAAARKSKNPKKKKKKEKAKIGGAELLSPAEPPPERRAVRAVPIKKIPFRSRSSAPGRAVRDDPRRLLGNYGEAFAGDTQSCDSGDDEDEAPPPPPPPPLPSLPPSLEMA